MRLTIIALILSIAALGLGSFATFKSLDDDGDQLAIEAEMSQNTWMLLGYEQRHAICWDWLSFYSDRRSQTFYPPCMACGPEEFDFTTGWSTTCWPPD